MHFINAYYKQNEKPFDYLLAYNKPDTPPDNQILADLFGKCCAYHFGVNSIVESTPVETQAAGKRREYVCDFGKKVNSTKCDYSPERKQQTHPYWSDASIPEWQKYTLRPPASRKIPEGYAIIQMYATSRNNINTNRLGVDINEERYWSLKIKHVSIGHTKWVNLHEDVPTVRTFVQ